MPPLTTQTRLAATTGLHLNQRRLSARLSPRPRPSRPSIPGAPHPAKEGQGFSGAGLSLDAAYRGEATCNPRQTPAWRAPRMKAAFTAEQGTRLGGRGLGAHIGPPSPSCPAAGRSARVFLCVDSLAHQPCSSPAHDRRDSLFPIPSPYSAPFTSRAPTSDSPAHAVGRLVPTGACAW